MEVDRSYGWLIVFGDDRRESPVSPRERYVTDRYTHRLWVKVYEEVSYLGQPDSDTIIGVAFTLRSEWNDGKSVLLHSSPRATSISDVVKLYGEGQRKVKSRHSVGSVWLFLGFLCPSPELQSPSDV